MITNVHTVFLHLSSYLLHHVLIGTHRIPHTHLVPNPKVTPILAFLSETPKAAPSPKVLWAFLTGVSLVLGTITASPSSPLGGGN